MIKIRIVSIFNPTSINAGSIWPTPNSNANSNVKYVNMSRVKKTKFFVGFFLLWIFFPEITKQIYNFVFVLFPKKLGFFLL